MEQRTGNHKELNKRNRSHRRLHKKALTPLIATVLLISFASAVGVVVMNLGSAQVEEEAECPLEVGLAFAVLKGKEHVCFDAKTKSIQFTLKNGKNTQVQGLVVNILGRDGSQSEDLSNAKMPKAGTYRGRIAYSVAQNGPLELVEIIPKILPFDEEQICTEQALVVEKVAPC